MMDVKRKRGGAVKRVILYSSQLSTYLRVGLLFVGPLVSDVTCSLNRSTSSTVSG